MIDWFRGIEGKTQRTFACFDIINFYLSISEDLLKKAVNFANEHVELTDSEVESSSKPEKHFCSRVATLG